jgi:hypothetical protein
MTKLADRIREGLKPQLEPDEELRSVGQVTSGPFSAMQPWILITGIGKSWHVGVTQKRVIFVRLKASSKPDERMRFATPLNNVKLNGRGIVVIAAEDGMPQAFKFHFGARRATGLDIDEFKAALATGLGDESVAPRGARPPDSKETPA